MRIAVLSDIHSNYHAFKACYEDAVKSGAEGFIFLGDYISDLSEPRRTMDLVYEIQAGYPTLCIRGNRERYMLDCENGCSEFVRGSKSGSLLYTYEQLQKKDLDFFRGLKISDTVEINGIRLELAHASMDDDRYYFDSKDGGDTEVFSRMNCAYLLTGHSHRQFVLQKGGKTIINPGSVGIPQDGTVNPQYAILDIQKGNISCQLCEVAYDITEVIRAQFASGLVDYAKYWAIGVLHDIIKGEECVLNLLQAIPEADFGNEDVWHSEAIKMGMKVTEEEILEFWNSRDVSSK